MIHGQLLGSHFAVAIIADALLDLSIPPVGPSQAPSLFFFASNLFRFDFMYLNGHIRRPLGLVSISMVMVKKRHGANAGSISRKAAGKAIVKQSGPKEFNLETNQNLTVLSFASNPERVLRSPDWHDPDD